MELKLRELEGTALITVVARARASQNPNEDFYDPWAEEIVGNLTPEQIKSVETGRVNAGVLVRELAFDAAVAKILKEKPQGVVANLGARLARHSPGAAVLFDTATPFFARHAHRIVRGVKPGLFGGWGFKYDARPEQVKALFPVLGDIEVSNYGDSGLLRRLHGSMKLFFRLLRPVFTDSLFVTARLGERPLFF